MTVGGMITVTIVVVLCVLVGYTLGSMSDDE